jgi:hypothetical protein
MVPATSALLGLLALKLIDKERRSHITDFNFDEALGLFAGLNVLPKTTFATDYSYRTVRENQQRLLAGWISRLLPRLDPEPDAFSLDFHSSPHRGEDSVLENHYVPMRGKAVPSILTFFAQAVKSRLLCYSDSTIVRQRAAGQLLEFVKFCRSILGADPAWLYFDSRFTTYAEMSRLNARGKTSFIADFRGGVFPHTSFQKGLFFQCLARHVVSRFGGDPCRLFCVATREDDAVFPYSEGPSVVGLGLRPFF